MLTIFGYSAPKTDAEAIKLMKKAWGNIDKRPLEEVSVIDIIDEESMLNTWKDFIHTHHYRYSNSFFDSYLAKFPRRTCETIFATFCLNLFSDGSNGFKENFDWEQLWKGEEDIVSLRSTLLLGMRGMAAYAWHAARLGFHDADVDAWFVKGMVEFAKDHSAEEWLDLLMEFGQINLKCMAVLDKANTETYGTPVPTTVPLTVEPGPFIVVTGHDLHDLKQLLEQTDGKGVNIYTHGEMLPCHAYPELKKHPQLKGNFGTAWQNQQKEFVDVPGAFLFTTNCIMPPKENYKANIFTTDMVGFDGCAHIEEKEDGTKDFSAVINRAIELGGYKEAQEFTGINGGHEVTTGFGHGTVLGIADKVIDAVKAGAIKHFFLVGGCDGAKVGRNYYTEFVKQTPNDPVVLTLACGKYHH